MRLFLPPSGRRRRKRRLSNRLAKRKLAVECLEPRWVLASAIGSEFQVNSTTADDQFLSAATMNAAGDFVVVWDSIGQDGDGHGIVGRRFDAGGTALGGEFQVNTNATGDQLFPRVAADGTGNFVAVWESEGVSGRGIFGQRYDSAGAAVGGEFQVNTTTASDQLTPAVAMSRSGQFVVVWDSFGQDGDGQGIFGRRYDAGGNPLGGEFQVNTNTTNNQFFPDVAMADDGSFVAVWESQDQDGDGAGIFAQRFAADGTMAGSEFQVNSVATNNQTLPAVAMNGSGRFVVVWHSEVAGGHDILAQRYAADGTPQGSMIRVNDQLSSVQARPKVAVNEQGNFVVTWDRLDADGDGRGVLARRFDRTGAALTSEFIVNTTTVGNQAFPVVTDSDPGDFVVVWESRDQDGDGLGVFGQRFRVNRAPVAVDDTASTTENQSATADVLANDTDVDNPISDFSLDSIDTVTVNGLSTGNALVTGSVTIVSSEISFDPATDFDELDDGDTATVTVGYTMSDDGGATSSADLVITVSGENDAPLAINDTDSTRADSPLAVDVLANDTDVDAGDQPSNFSLDQIGSVVLSGSAVDPSLVTGSVQIAGNQVQFDPGSDFNNLDEGETATVTITYTMSDDSGASSSAELLMTVVGVASSSISGFVYVDVDNDGIKDQPEVGIPGVTIVLSGSGSATATTAADGSYRFEKLRAGVYTIAQTQPAAFADGIDTPGTPRSGTVENDRFVDVAIGSGVAAAGYNFGEFSLLVTLATKRLLLTSTPPASELARQFSGEGSGTQGDAITPNANPEGESLLTRLDVNQDGNVSPQDVLIVINRLNAGVSQPTLLQDGEPDACDVNRDGVVSPSDVLLIVNQLNASSSAAEGEGIVSELASIEELRERPSVQASGSVGRPATAAHAALADHSSAVDAWILCNWDFQSAAYGGGADRSPVSGTAGFECRDQYFAAADRLATSRQLASVAAVAHEDMSFGELESLLALLAEDQLALSGLRD